LGKDTKDMQQLYDIVAERLKKNELEKNEVKKTLH
jgi:hypothetical protein